MTRRWTSRTPPGRAAIARAEQAVQELTIQRADLARRITALEDR